MRIVIKYDAQVYEKKSHPYAHAYATYRISRNIGEHYIWWFAQKLLLVGF